MKKTTEMSTYVHGLVDVTTYNFPKKNNNKKKKNKTQREDLTKILEILRALWFGISACVPGKFRLPCVHKMKRDMERFYVDMNTTRIQNTTVGRDLWIPRLTVCIYQEISYIYFDSYIRTRINLEDSEYLIRSQKKRFCETNF